jgi:hypothetical protein
MNFQEQLKKHLSPGDFERMTAWMIGLGADERMAMMQFIAARETQAPAVGDAAPDFDLPRLGQSERVRLSDLRGRRPVALIFGSYT